MSLSYPQRPDRVRGTHGWACEDFLSFSVMAAHSTLTPVLGLTLQPCFSCQLSNERAGLPSNNSASKQSCTHVYTEGSHF